MGGFALSSGTAEARRSAFKGCDGKYDGQKGNKEGEAFKVEKEVKGWGH